ncbi:uncharacterized protein EDB91DRAFT_620447 [Suillus paluster]|uniref:uncharacterized protein n=1 Tax=Suillus paluster TaxID=48578 RepID=UPI001B884444|nr:uncharacterized protein EDB91DRAFT_620447 [Suillus paluster]KAG1734069.1 hypothetical protein EDB91DRAFT_620447 [Suillus paluster]
MQVTSPLPWQIDPAIYFASPIQSGSHSAPINASSSNFAVNNAPTPFNLTEHSRKSFNADFAVYGDARNSDMSSVDKRMAAVAQTPSPLSLRTDSVCYISPLIQSGSKSTPTNASAGNFAINDRPTPVNQTQNSRQNPNMDSFAMHGDTGTSGGGRTAAIAGQAMCWLCKRRKSRSPVVMPSKSRLRRTDIEHEVNGHVPPHTSFPYETTPLSYHAPSIQPMSPTKSDLTNSSVGNFAVGAPPTPLNQTQYSRQNSHTDFAVYGDSRSPALSSPYNQIPAVAPTTSPNSPLPYPVSYLLPIQPGSQSPPTNASTGNIAIHDLPTPFNRQTSHTDFALYGDARTSTISSVDKRMPSVIYLAPPIQPGSQLTPINASVSNVPTPFNLTEHSRKSSNGDFAVSGDAQNSVMSSLDRRMTAVAQTTSPLPWRTDSERYISPPIQSGSESTPTDASAGNFVVRNSPTSFNQTQNSCQNPNADSFVMHGDTGTSDGRQTAAIAGQAPYRPPTRVIVHIDAEDVVPDDDGVIHLPPQYSEHRRVLALQSESVPRPTSSHP